MTSAFRLKFSVMLRTEYHLYDFISTLGNVGGTLGLFIGFSFSGTISYILSFIVARLKGQQTHFEHQIINVDESPINGLTSQQGTTFVQFVLFFSSSNSLFSKRDDSNRRAKVERRIVA